MARIIVGAIALAIMGMMGAVAMQASFNTAGDDVLNEKETFTPDAGNITTLDDSNLNRAYYNSSDAVTVTDENGTEMSDPADYEWFSRNGTLKTNTTGDLAGDADANITYGYILLSEEQKQMEQLVFWIPKVIGPALLFLLVIFMGAFIWQ